jgi:hypothetical protein
MWSAVETAEGGIGLTRIAVESSEAVPGARSNVEPTADAGTIVPRSPIGLEGLRRSIAQ